MTFANKISLLRLFLIPVFIVLLFYFTPQRPYLQGIIIAIFLIAIVTDFLDGLIARIKKQTTKFGTLIDPLADKLLLLNAFIWIYHLRNSLPLASKIPQWVIIIIVSRDLIILGGVMILFFLQIEIKILPSLWGKLTTFFQMVTIFGVLVNFPYAAFLWSTAVVFTVISGVQYISRGVKAINVSDNPIDIN